MESYIVLYLCGLVCMLLTCLFIFTDEQIEKGVVALLFAGIFIFIGAFVHGTDVGRRQIINNTVKYEIIKEDKIRWITDTKPSP